MRGKTVKLLITVESEQERQEKRAREWRRQAFLWSVAIASFVLFVVLADYYLL